MPLERDSWREIPIGLLEEETRRFLLALER